VWQCSKLCCCVPETDSSHAIYRSCRAGSNILGNKEVFRSLSETEQVGCKQLIVHVLKKTAQITVLSSCFNDRSATNARITPNCVLFVCMVSSRLDQVFWQFALYEPVVPAKDRPDKNRNLGLL